MFALDLPARLAGRRDQLSANAESIEIFDDDVGIDDDIAIVEDQRRQFFQGRDLRVRVIGLARRDRGRDELDVVDQAEFDRGNAHLAGEWRGGGEGEFHGMSLKKSSSRNSPVIASQRVGAERRPMTGSANQSRRPRRKTGFLCRLAPPQYTRARLRKTPAARSPP